MSSLYDAIKKNITELNSKSGKIRTITFIDDCTWTSPITRDVTISGYGKGEEYNKLFTESCLLRGDTLTAADNGSCQGMASAVPTTDKITIKKGKSYLISVSNDIQASIAVAPNIYLSFVGKLSDIYAENTHDDGRYRYYPLPHNKLRGIDTYEYDSKSNTTNVKYSDTFLAEKGSGAGGTPPDGVYKFEEIQVPPPLGHPGDPMIKVRGWRLNRTTEPKKACTGKLEILIQGTWEQIDIVDDQYPTT